MAEDTGEIGREAAEAVGFRNIKDTEVTSGGPAFYSNLAMGNAINQQQHGYSLANAIVGKIAEMIIATSPSEGGVDVASLGQLAKLVQGTPPPTNLPTQGQ
jgi:hypothetical protein